MTSKYQKHTHCEAQHGLEKLERVLEGWIEALHRYIAVHREDGKLGDLPFYYDTERPQVGFLAAGAWLSGGAALEEWRGEKHSGASGTRCDFWLQTGPNDDDSGFQIEAKRELSRDIGRIEAHLKKAVVDISNCSGSNDQKLGVLFVRPTFPASNSVGIDQEISQWLEELDTSVPHDAIAWFFPDWSEWPKGKERYGLALLARRPGKEMSS